MNWVHLTQTMNTLCRSRYLAALFALVSVLFMQFAVAWYECPGENIAVVSQAHATSSDSRVGLGCDGIDAAQPGLCHAHAQVGNQSLDKSGFPHVLAFAGVASVAALHEVEYVSMPAFSRQDAGFLTRTTAPAIAIRNCCFRI